MNVELVAQMFKNYQSNVLFHLEGIDELRLCRFPAHKLLTGPPSYGESAASFLSDGAHCLLGVEMRVAHRTRLD